MSEEQQGVPGRPIHNQETRRNVKKSLRLSILDGGAYAAMMGLTQNYITPFALALKATTAQIGLISSVPNLMMALAQLASPAMAERAGSRKGVLLPGAFINALSYLPLFLVPYFFRSIGVWWLLTFYAVCLASDAITQPTWGSMMADLVHEDLRGRYFSYRGRIAQFITLVFSLAAGLILQAYTGHVFAGFAILFCGAAGFRLLSFFFLSRMYEPTPTREKADAPSVPALVRTLGASNLGRFTVYISLIYFGMMISGPFFSVFMLRDLHFSYVTYTIVASASTVAVLVFLPFWGRRADRAGNLKIIQITSILMPVVPLLWVLNGNPVYLIVTNVVSGFTWSGFNLASVNFVYDAADPAGRTKRIAVFNSITCVALSLGALLGGYLVPHLPKTLGFQFRTLFIISGALRAVIVVLLLRTIIEVRRVSKINTIQLMLGRSGANDKGNNSDKPVK